MLRIVQDTCKVHGSSTAGTTIEGYNDEMIEKVSPQSGGAAKPQFVLSSLYRFIVISFFLSPGSKDFAGVLLSVGSVISSEPCSRVVENTLDS